jgi:hypothetical protein
MEALDSPLSRQRSGCAILEQQTCSWRPNAPRGADSSRRPATGWSPSPTRSFVHCPGLARRPAGAALEEELFHTMRPAGASSMLWTRSCGTRILHVARSPPSTCLGSRSVSCRPLPGRPRGAHAPRAAAAALPPSSTSELPEPDHVVPPPLSSPAYAMLDERRTCARSLAWPRGARDRVVATYLVLASSLWSGDSGAACGPEGRMPESGLCQAHVSLGARAPRRAFVLAVLVLPPRECSASARARASPSFGEIAARRRRAIGSRRSTPRSTRPGGDRATARSERATNVPALVHAGGERGLGRPSLLAVVRAPSPLRSAPDTEDLQAAGWSFWRRPGRRDRHAAAWSTPARDEDWRSLLHYTCVAPRAAPMRQPPAEFPCHELVWPPVR